MAGIPTVTLYGRMVGPTVIEHGGPPEEDDYLFKFTPSDSGGEIDVNWRQIYWIDAYPHAAGNTPAGRKPKDLEKRKISVKADSELIGQYLNGAIVESIAMSPEDNSTMWAGPQMDYAAGPQGTSYPPCLCPH
jgi:hypothetical protein